MASRKSKRDTSQTVDQPFVPMDVLGSEKQQNINISAYRVLYILLLLVQHQSLGLHELNKYLYDNPLIQRTYNSETITKYINTLRKVGCKIPRSSSRHDYSYILKENPFPIQLSEEEMAAAHEMLRVLACQSDEALHMRYHQFLAQVVWMLSKSQKEVLGVHLDGARSSLPVQQRRALMNRYKEYCADALVLEVQYQADAVQQILMVVEPIRVKQKNGQAYLLGVDRSSRGLVKLNLEKMASVRQLPSKVNQSSKLIQVVFQLYGRLAKTYRLYPGEEVIFSQGETLQIKARTDDVKALLNRLLKYNLLCQVISPASARQEMRQRIQELIQAAG